MFFVLLFILLVPASLVLAGLLFMKTTRFGAVPGKEYASRFARSPQYRNGKFHNLEVTPNLVGTSFSGMVVDYFLHKKENLKPKNPVPCLNPDMAALPENGDYVLWFGHSSCLLRLNGQTILLDPVLGPCASPVFFSTRTFPGYGTIPLQNFPIIDCLVLSHDHWDHLDYKTVNPLKDKIRSIVCPLGVGAHLKRWGFASSTIRELDWGEACSFPQTAPVSASSTNVIKGCEDPALTIYARPSRHFSGRTLTRDCSLWASFILETPSQRIFFSGDGGYGKHFAAIGEEFGSFQLALMECGQYDSKWPYVHMAPEESFQAAQDVRAAAMLPLHAGKFSICNHPWNDPYIRIAAAARQMPHASHLSPVPRLVTPPPGALFMLDCIPSFLPWWLAAKP